MIHHSQSITVMFKFKPIFKSVIWGGDKIAPYKGIQTEQENIGEMGEMGGLQEAPWPRT